MIMENPQSLPKAYEPGKVEQKWYRFWLAKGYFIPPIDNRQRPFVIIMPPPNITGELHIGHALTDTLEDIIVRWHRMKGEPTLWLPGVDHAGIATQVVLERELARKGLTRQELGREAFLKEAQEWAQQYRERITRQHQRLGASCDWSRERFTLDEGPSLAVRTAFVRLYQKGLIYRGERIISWCPRCATALSDLEVDHREIEGKLYYIRYPFPDGGFITVATTRPETMLGDTAVAVHPADKRYESTKDKRVLLPLTDRAIPIITDEAVDPAFGTGALKITPAHDPNDFEIAERHNLGRINIFNPDATLNHEAGKYAGLDRFTARAKIVEALKSNGLLEAEEVIRHAVGHCQRCGTMIEPTISQQWFVRTKPLAQPAIEAVTSGRIKIVPERFTSIYLNWMENIRDWCISRQLWWGHRIPVWYCKDCEAITVSVETPHRCSQCSSVNIWQDLDVLDTWFSSALWPHSTLGWPEETEDFTYFYPTTVLETGYDILFFWVARMIMMGIEDTGKIPFEAVYLHGLVRDEKGEKMSKVKGNVINPIATLETYGTDALRFALCYGAAPGNDVHLSTERLEAGRNFANKMWNAARFVISKLSSTPLHTKETGPDHLNTEDRWILSLMTRTIDRLNSLMAQFQLGEALGEIHEFVWGSYCDWYIEMAKVRINQGDLSALPVLTEVLETSLRLLHPFMPFVTEEIWQTLRHLSPERANAESIVISPYPASDPSLLDPEAESFVGLLQDIVRAVRNIRAEYKISPERQVEAQVYLEEETPGLNSHLPLIEALSRARPVRLFRGQSPSTTGGVVQVISGAVVVIPLETMVDISSERERLLRELESARQEISRLESRLSDEAFLTRAPQVVIAKEKERLSQARGRLQKLEEQYSLLTRARE